MPLRVCHNELSEAALVKANNFAGERLFTLRREATGMYNHRLCPCGRVRQRIPRAHEGNAALTCRYFGISRQTFYRWKRRYDPYHLRSLEDGSHRPHRRRQPTWSAQLADRVLALRRQYPRWGKDKLVVLLRREGRGGFRPRWSDAS
jgi:transposase-like protein